METAIAYIRVSTDRQVTDGTSLLSQRKRVEEYVALKGYSFDRLFVEEGESAKTDSRPELQTMLSYCKKNRGRVQVLIFPKIDRFARYSEDYHFLKRYLRNLGIRVESTDERFDDTPAGRFLESVLAAQAQFDNDIRSERSRGGMREASAQGRWVCGNAPVGYRNIRFAGKATIEPHPVKGPLITGAYNRLASGRYRPESVRRWLAGKGVALSRSRFYEVLRSRTYLGIIVSFGLNLQAAPPFVPLVSERTFFHAQEALRKHEAKRLRHRDQPDFALRGTIMCSCGRYLTASWARGRSREYPYYRCMHCPNVNLQRGRVERQFLQSLEEIKERYALSPSVREELVVAWKEETAASQDRKVRLANEIDKLRDLQKAISLKNAQGIIPDDLAREHLDETSRKLIQLRAELDESGSPHEDMGKVVDFAQAFLGELSEHWRHADLESKKHIQAFFFPDGIELPSEEAIRTDRNGPPTGSSGPSAPKMSAMVDHDVKNTNPVASTQHDLSHQVQSLLRLYQEFS